MIFRVKQLIAIVIVGVAIAFFSWPAMAQQAPDFYEGNWPNASGDYPLRQEYQSTWQVVDSDPQGLNCRDQIPTFTNEGKVEVSFSEGTILKAVERERGVVEIVSDLGDKPWLGVELPDDKSCWVRANQQYVVPVN
jgi:hypothetical protein